MLASRVSMHVSRLHANRTSDISVLWQLQKTIHLVCRRFSNSSLAEWAHLVPLRARLNHGSFGAAPASVLAKQQELRAVWAANPDGAEVLICRNL